jgi:hypothetical protein
MLMGRKKLYGILFFSCIAGYIWLYLNINLSPDVNNIGGVCFIKHVTGIPCPSCGSTRSVLSLIHGNIAEALYWNPIGLILILILIITPFWILFDIILSKESLLKAYIKAEQKIKNYKIAIPLIALVIINWIWNIKKDL